mgnify:FL=1
MNQSTGSKSIQRFIEKLEILKGLRIDITKMTQKDTIQTLAEKSGVIITEKKAKELGIELIDRIGYTKMSIASASRGIGSREKPTQEQIQRLSKLGISLELVKKRNIIQEFIKNLETLKKQGVDVTKITPKDTIQTLAEKSGVVLTEKQSEELGIELNDKIGQTKTGIASAHRGKGTYQKPTQEQVQRLSELGISLDVLERGTIIRKFMKELDILIEQKIDIAKMTETDTIQTLAEKSGVVITKEKADELGIRLNYKIGGAKKYIAKSYRKGGMKTEQEQEQRLLELGVSLELPEKKSITQEFIEKLKILEKQGIEVSNIQIKDTIQTLAQKSGVVITEEKAKELGIRLNDKIGQTKMSIARAYRRNGSGEKPTQEHVQELQKLGISLERRNITQEFIEKLWILKEQGIDITKITKTDTIRTLAEKSGVVITEEKAKKLGIELSDRIGQTKTNVASAHRGDKTREKPTEEQVQRLSELGISLELLEKRDITQEFIEKLQILKGQKIDVSKITLRDTVETLAKKSGVVLTEEKAKELGIELSDRIGPTKANITSVYRGNMRGKKPTQKQIQKLSELGISLEKRKRTGKEVVGASIDSIKHMEMLDNAYSEVKILEEEVRNKRGNQNRKGEEKNESKYTW